MSAIQPYLANALINHILRGTGYTVPANIYIGLFVGAIEVSGGGYARQSLQGTSHWTSPVNGASSNITAVNFPTATAPWGTIDHYGVFDALTSGNLLIFDVIAVPKVIGLGDVFVFPISSLNETFQ